MKCLFLLFAIAVSFPQVKCQATSDEINPINLDAFIKSTFSPVSIYDRDQLIGSGYQINPFFTIVDLNLVEKYSNFYENLYVRNESCYQGNGSCIYECLQNVAFIWKASPLRQLSLSPEWSILVVENEEEIERWESLFFEALEVVPTAGNGNPEDGHLDLNGDGKVDQLEKGLVKMVQLCKDLIAMGFTKLMVNGGEEMAPL